MVGGAFSVGCFNLQIHGWRGHKTIYLLCIEEISIGPCRARDQNRTIRASNSVTIFLQILDIPLTFFADRQGTVNEFRAC
jgi:hypothetical protein